MYLKYHRHFAILAQYCLVWHSVEENFKSQLLFSYPLSQFYVAHQLHCLNSIPSNLCTYSTSTVHAVAIIHHHLAQALYTFPFNLNRRTHLNWLQLPEPFPCAPHRSCYWSIHTLLQLSYPRVTKGLHYNSTMSPFSTSITPSGYSPFILSILSPSKTLDESKVFPMFQ